MSATDSWAGQSMKMNSPSFRLGSEICRICASLPMQVALRSRYCEAFLALPPMRRAQDYEQVQRWHDLRAMAMSRAERTTDIPRQNALMDEAYLRILSEAWRWQCYREQLARFQGNGREMLFGKFTLDSGMEHLFFPTLREPTVVFLDKPTLRKIENNQFSIEELERLRDAVTTLCEAVPHRRPHAFDRTPIFQSEARIGSPQPTPDELRRPKGFARFIGWLTGKTQDVA